MTILQLLKSKLPYRYVHAVLKNIDPQSKEDIVRQEAGSFESEMMVLFDWESSREGYDFWENVLESVIDGHELPPIPIDINYAPNTAIVTKSMLYVMNMEDQDVNYGFNIDLEKVENLPPQLKEKVYLFVN